MCRKLRLDSHVGTDVPFANRGDGWHHARATKGTVEATLMILRWVNKVPAMATCSKCNLKFFTPKEYSKDSVGAEEYLESKFETHHCEQTTRVIDLRKR